MRTATASIARAPKIDPAATQRVSATATAKTTTTMSATHGCTPRIAPSVVATPLPPRPLRTSSTPTTTPHLRPRTRPAFVAPGLPDPDEARSWPRRRAIIVAGLSEPTRKAATTPPAQASTVPTFTTRRPRWVTDGPAAGRRDVG